MKTWKKILRAILALIIIAWIVCATMFTLNEKRIKEYSGYCMDEVRAQLWEYVWNISNMYEGKNGDWYYLYNWNVGYEWVDYTYYCRVLGKENVDLQLEPVNQPEVTESQNNVETEEARIAACEDRIGFYLNTADFTVSWENEEEAWASFSRNGHVIREKDWEVAEDDVNCFIDMVDGSVNIEFSNHLYNGELQSDESNVYTIIWENNWFDEDIEAGKLVLRKGYEDHTDYIFIEQAMWQNYLDQSKIVDGNTVVFKWEITSIDWAAGSHYYNADSIEELHEVETE